MTERPQYRYSPPAQPGPAQTTRAAASTAAPGGSCQQTFHTQLIWRGQPRRYRSPACRVAEHRRLN